MLVSMKYRKLTAVSPSIALVARVRVCKVLETDLWVGTYRHNQFRIIPQ